MDPKLIAELLKPFLSPAIHNIHNLSCDDSSQAASPDSQESATLSNEQLTNISTYIDLLIRWNSRINLTAIRDPEQIVSRHFGESLFAARHLFSLGARAHVAPGLRPGDPNHASKAADIPTHHLLDIGSGPGFPALPIKIWAPQIALTMVESNQKKVTFLREVCRALTLTSVNVLTSRAEDLPPVTAHTVTLRAVERFETILPVVTHLTRPGGRVALLIGESQLKSAKAEGIIKWSPSISIPQSISRILLIGSI